jgi:hypothetical protein
MKTLFKIQFIDENKKTKTIHAHEVNPSSFLGLIEISSIVFLGSSEK